MSVKDALAAVDAHALSRTKQEALTGSDVSYYLVHVPDPKRLEPYTMEAEDVVEVLHMEFAEATIFTGIIRLSKMMLGLGKPGNTEVYEAEKLVYYAQRALAKAKRREAGKKSLPTFDITKPRDAEQDFALALDVLARYKDGIGPLTPGDAAKALDAIQAYVVG